MTWLGTPRYLRVCDVNMMRLSTHHMPSGSNPLQANDHDCQNHDLKLLRAALWSAHAEATDLESQWGR